MIRFLVLGASGMAGHLIATYLLERGYDVTGFCRRSAPKIYCIEGDAYNVEQLRTIVEEGSFDVLVNAVGILNQDAEERKERAAYLNAYLPHALAALTEGTPTRLFHMSTDCVFRGNTGPYTENSSPDGKTFYDRSKALGEIDDGKNLTFRNSIVGPDTNPEGIGLLNWFMRQNGPIKGFSNVLWTGLTTLELAKAMESAAMEDASGLVNMVPSVSISKCELLQLFNRYFRGSVSVEPVDEPVLDKTLVRTRRTCSFEPASYDQQIAELAAWTRSHAELYPHYHLEASYAQ
ncbi:SDR family oxidoreductase [Eggerthella guodeyinii]|uniref:SDR family oxidoreductase n=1 Tax=Eggerthella guodeyinii TaxID=2690837 RepID=UPI0012B11821|nr:sugar nucleotide-binding protein [Eggerthella guodeyinii]